MANIGKEDTNGSQFFIVQADRDTILQMETLLDAQYEGMTLKEYIKAGYDTEYPLPQGLQTVLIFWPHR